MITLHVASRTDTDWAQRQVTQHHYLRSPVDPRCSPLAYLVKNDQCPIGCLIFGRPECTRCFVGALTFGGAGDIAVGRARLDRWEVINLARVWLHPDTQGPAGWGRSWLATWAISRALRQVVVDYLVAYPPCYLDEPWRLRAVLSYCDLRIHSGALYRAAGFQLAYTNERRIATFWRPLRSLQGHERKQIERLCQQSYRSRVYRSQRAVDAYQEALPL